MSRSARNTIALAMGIVLGMILFASMIPNVHAQTVISTSESNNQSSSGAQSANQNEINIISSAPEQQTLNATTAASDTLRLSGDQTTHFKTNTMVGLTAASSFSQQNCGNITSAGLSGAGWTAGASRVRESVGCEARLNAESFGRSAVNERNLFGEAAESKVRALQDMSIYAGCTANQQMANGCFYRGLIDRKTLENITEHMPSGADQKRRR